MNKQKSLVVNRSDDTYSLPHKSLKTRSSRMRDINAKTSNLSLGNNLSVNFNSELSSKAARNGIGFVYHRSDCGYPYYRVYGFGGEARGLRCELHLESGIDSIDYYKTLPCSMSAIIWSEDYNWTEKEVYDAVKANRCPGVPQ